MSDLRPLAAPPSSSASLLNRAKTKQMRWWSGGGGGDGGGGGGWCWKEGTYTLSTAESGTSILRADSLQGYWVQAATFFRGFAVL